MRQGYCSLGDLAEEAYDCLKGQTLVSSYTLFLSRSGTELYGDNKTLTFCGSLPVFEHFLRT